MQLEKNTKFIDVLACFDGLALQKLLNPEFDLDRAYLELEKRVRTTYTMTE
ncbi:hypothetical protein ACE3MQ_13100 [Paenibacillus lentus]